LEKEKRKRKSKRMASMPLFDATAQQQLLSFSREREGLFLSSLLFPRGDSRGLLRRTTLFIKRNGHA
jgi:hypothetical protein